MRYNWALNTLRRSCSPRVIHGKTEYFFSSYYDESDISFDISIVRKGKAIFKLSDDGSVTMSAGEITTIACINDFAKSGISLPVSMVKTESLKIFEKSTSRWVPFKKGMRLANGVIYMDGITKQKKETNKKLKMVVDGDDDERSGGTKFYQAELSNA